MYKYRAEITKDEEIRYISHLDYASAVERAICRAHLPAAYSEGFNPHMKLAFASALAVGVTSDAEYMDFELTKPLCQPEVFDCLRAHLPQGIRLMRLKDFEGRHKALMSVVDLAQYDIRVAFDGDEAAAVRAVQDFNAAEEFVYTRITPKKTREIEVKQYVQQPLEMHIEPHELILSMDIIITQSGSIKPSEVLTILRKNFAMPVEEQKALIHRRALLSGGRPPIDLV